MAGKEKSLEDIKNENVDLVRDHDFLYTLIYFYFLNFVYVAYFIESAIILCFACFFLFLVLDEVYYSSVSD